MNLPDQCDESAIRWFTHNAPSKRSSAAALFVSGGRLMLVEPTYKPAWEPPGGVVEADESPRAAVAREVHEELGLTITPGRLLVMDWIPPFDGRAEGFAFVYDGGNLSNEELESITLEPNELKSWTWCTHDEVQQRTRPITARRLAAAKSAAATNTLAELENGYPITAPRKPDSQRIR